MQKIKIIKADITDLAVDCIVNAANKTLLGGGGVDGAIHRKAGHKLYEECLTLGGCETSEAKITKGYDLKAKYVIHTVGPIYSQKDKEKKAIELRNCYLNSLKLALDHKNIRSIAFPAISTGVYHYPLKEATKIAIKAVVDFLKENETFDIEVIFCCFDEKTFDVYIEEGKNYSV